MTKSHPSHEIYQVDIPEVKDFSAVFHYNFFTSDESVNDTGGVPEKILIKSPDEIDSEFIQYATTRAPRFIEFRWSPALLNDIGDQVTDTDIRNNVHKQRSQDENLISDNLDNIVTEDHFASNDFISVQFHDGDIENKVFYLASGSYEQHTLDDENDHDTSHSRAASRLSQLVPSHISPTFLSRAMSHEAESLGLHFFETSDSKKGKKSKSSSTKHRSIRNNLAINGRERQMLINKFFARMRSFHIPVQINGKLFYDVVNRTVNDPNSPYGDDLHGLHQLSKQISMASKQRFSLQLADRDFKTFAPFVKLDVRRTAHHTDRRPGEIVGYLIDKVEVTADGKTQHHAPIVLERASTHASVDFRIRYNSTYVYSIRTIAKFTLPAIDDDTGDVATIQILVSSKPSHKVHVKAREHVPPPPPADLNFNWNYETDQLLIHWAFPPNSQQDIKKFQLFRRADTNHPFELIKMYDFDDSLVKYADHENPSPDLVEYLTSPASYYIDDDFSIHSHYIYAVASIDAHGMTSNYSAQFKVSFDRFKNKIVKSLVSHSGAPKPYPNLYLEADTFVDTIRVNGPHSKRMRLYFNPEFYHLFDDDERLVRILATKQLGSEYKIQFINLDNQLAKTMTVRIDDRIRAANRRIVFPKQRFGAQKRQKTKD